MGWDCPYYINVNGNCTRLEKICQPLQEGCVLEGKVKFISSEKDEKIKDDGKYEHEKKY